MQIETPVWDILSIITIFVIFRETPKQICFMKKNFVYFLLAILALCSCQDKLIVETIPELLSEDIVFTASIEDGTAGETKTSLNADWDVLWKQGDQVSIFAGSTINEQYQVTDASDGKTSANLYQIPGEFVAGTAINNNVAFYPYSSTATIEKSGNTYIISNIRLPEYQVYKEASFGNGAFPMAAVTGSTEEKNLNFKNILGGLMIKLKGSATIAAIRITGNNQEILCGAAEVTVSAGSVPSIRLNYTPAKSVILHCGAGVALDTEKETPFIIALPPVTFTKGFRVIVIDTEGKQMEISTSKSLTIARSSMIKMEAVEYVGAPASKALLPSFPLSAGLDRTISAINFYVNSDKVTETLISNEIGYSPIYYEQNGSVVNYYTKGEAYQLTNGYAYFSGLLNISSLDLTHFDASQCTNFCQMFLGCLNLQEIKFGNFNTSNATDMSQMFQDCISLEAVDLSSFNTTNVQNMNYMFLRCYALKELDLSNFDTRNVTQMGEMFECCYRLEKLDISSFTSDHLQYGPGLFNRCYSLLKLNLGSFDLSNLPSNYYTCYKLASRSRNCAVLCTPATKAVMLSSEAQLQGYADYIQWFSPGETLPDLTMNYDPNLYRSTDFSKDKTVKMLNTATEGNGINVVIMGEAYSDRLIADGTYEQDMTAAMNQVFSIEPFKSFKHLFNVYMVTVVSENEVVGEFTALGYYHNAWFGNGGVDRDDVAINEYVSAAVGRDENRQVTTLIVVNENSGDGVAMVNGSGGISETDYYDYPAKLAGVAFACKSTDLARFKYTVCHEFGHAFAALHDEYVTETGEMETWESDFKKYYQAHAGWWANVSFTSDPNLVGWSQFLAPSSGYDETEVSIIEGALYSQGIWKSVDQSMMNAGGEYSVPAREAIYKKIHKVAYGETWQYNFQDFVAWDRQVLPKLPASSVSPAQSTAIKVKSLKSSHSKPLFKMEESIASDGRKVVTFIMD